MLGKEASVNLSWLQQLEDPILINQFACHLRFGKHFPKNNYLHRLQERMNKKKFFISEL